MKQHTISRLSGFSMYPTLREDDVLFLENVVPENIRAGDLVVFKKDDKSICHRIVGKCLINGKLYFREKGDNSFSGSKISTEQIVGRVEEIYRGKQKISPFNDRAAGFNILVGNLFRIIWLLGNIKRKIPLMKRIKTGRIFRLVAGVNRKVNAVFSRHAA